MDLLTITSVKGMLDSREQCLPNLFPDKTVPRAHRFEGKKASNTVQFISYYISVCRTLYF